MNVVQYCSTDFTDAFYWGCNCCTTSKQCTIPPPCWYLCWWTGQNPYQQSAEGLVTNPAVQISQARIIPSKPSSGVAALSVEVEYSGRKELPSELFTAMYVPQSVHPPLWHTGLAPGTSYSIQYNTAVPMPTFPQSTKATNPFDLGSGSSPAQAPEFPPMTSLKNALPNMAAPSWMPSQALPYPLGAPQLTPSFGASAMLPDPYKTQQLSSNLPLSP